MPILDPNVYVNNNIDPISNLQPTRIKIDPMSERLGSNTLPMGEAGVSKYDIGINRFNINEIERLRGEQQPWTAQLGNALNQALVGEVVGGTIEGIGWLGELKDTAKLLEGKEAELGNFMTEFGSSIRDWTQKVTPVYKTYQDGFNPAKWSWWMNNLPSVASTLSLLVPATGAVKGVSMLGNLLKVPNIAKIAGSLGMSTRAAINIEKGIVGVSQAVLSRHMENLMEASGKYEEIYQLALSKGYSENKAKEQASLAAADIYKTDWAMLLFDLPQYMMLGKSYGKAVQEIGVKSAKALGKSTVRPMMNHVFDTSLNLVGEGFEEAFQYVTAERYADLAKHRMDSTYKPKELLEYLKDGDMWTNAFFGLFGAGVFETAGRYLNKKLFGEISEDEQRAESITQIAPIIKQLKADKIKAEEIGDVASAETINKRIVATLASLHSELGTFDKMRGMLESMSNSDISDDILSVNGFDQSDLEHIKNNFPEYIKIADNVANVYDSFMKDKEKNYSPRTASQLALSTVMKMELSKYRNDLINQERNALNNLESGDYDYKELTTTGKQIVDYDIKINSINKQLSFLEKQLQNKDITPGKAEKLLNSKNTLKEEVKKLQQERKEIRYGKEYTIEDRKKDNDKIKNINKYLLDNYINVKRNIDYVEDAINVENEILGITDTLQDIQNYTITGKKPSKKKSIIPTQTKEEREQDLINKYQKRVNNIKEEVDKNKKESKDTNDLFFRKRISKLTDQDFLSSYNELTQDIKKVIQNALDYKNNNPTLSDDEDRQLGDILKREHSKLRFLQDKFNKIEYEETDSIPLEELSPTTIGYRTQISKEDKEQQLNNTFNRNIVDINDDATIFIIRNKKYYNLYTTTTLSKSLPGAINVDNNGNIISITLSDDSNKSVTFTEESIVDQIAYQLLLKEVSLYESRQKGTLNFEKEKELVEDKIEKDLKLKSKSEFVNELLRQDLNNLLTTTSLLESEIKGLIYGFKISGYTKDIALQDSRVKKLINKWIKLDEKKKQLLSKLNINDKQGFREWIESKDKKSIEEQIVEKQDKNLATDIESISEIEENEELKKIEKEFNHIQENESKPKDIIEEAELLKKQREEEEARAKKEQEKFTQISSQPIGNVLSERNSSVPIVMMQKDLNDQYIPEGAKQGVLFKKSKKYYVKFDGEQEVEFNEDITKPFFTYGIIVVGDVSNYKTILPVETKAGKNNIPIPDASGTNTEIIVNKEVTSPSNIVLRAGHFKDGSDGDEQLESYLQNRNNTLSNAFLDIKINLEPYAKVRNEDLLNRLKRALKGELSFNDFTEEELNSVPLIASLIDNNNIISNKVFIYTGGYTAKKFLKEEYIIDDFAEQYRTANKTIRKAIIKQLLEGKSVIIKTKGKTRGDARKHTDVITNKNVHEALNEPLINLKNKSNIVVGDGRILNINGEYIGITVDNLDNNKKAASRGSVLIETTKTCNGEPYLLKCNGAKLKQEHVEIIYDLYKEALTDNKGWSVKFKDDRIKGNFSRAQVLAMLVNFGDTTKVTKETHGILEEANPALHQNLKLKQLYLEDNSKLLHYGIDNLIDFSKEPSKEDKSAFIKYLTENMNYAYRYDLLNVVYNKPIKIGSFELTKDDINNGINTFELFALKNGYVTSDIEINPETDSILENPDILLDIQNPDDITVVDNSKPIIPEVKLESPTIETKESDITDKQKELIAKRARRAGFGNIKTRLYTHTNNYQVWDQKKELSNIRKMLGNYLPIDIVDRVIRIVDDNGVTREAWGITENASMVLYKAAEIGTGYHEAFHIVWTYLLSQDEQRGLVREARQKYSNLKNSSVDVIEEFLAEKFRERVLQTKSDKSISSYIKRIFDKLIDFIKNIFIDKKTKISSLTIDKLFDKIESGKYRRKAEALKDIRSDSYTVKLRSKYTKKQQKSITDVLFYKLVVENKLTDIENIKNIDFNKVKDSINALRDDWASDQTDTNLSNEDKNISLRYEQLWTDVTSDEQWPLFVKLMNDRLLALSFKRIEEEDEDLDNHTSKEFQRYDRASYEFDSKDSVLNNIKLFIATFPDTNYDLFTGLPKMVDFHTAWSRIMKDAWRANDIDELKNIFQNKARRNSFYNILLNGITDQDGNVIRPGINNADDKLQTQLEAAFKLYKHVFINLVKDSKNTYGVFSASTTKASDEAAKEWSIQFYENNLDYFKDDNKLSEKGQTKLKEISEIFTRKLFSKAINEYLHNNSIFNNIDDYNNIIIDLLSKLNIPIDSFTLYEIYEDLGNDITDETGKVIGKDKNSGLYNFINNYLSNIFNKDKSLIADLKTGVAFKDKKDESKSIIIENVLYNNNNIKTLADLVVKHNDDYIQDVVLGPDNAMFYIYSNSSFLTDFHRRIKDPLYLENLIQTVSNLTHKGEIASEILRQIKEEGKNLEIVTFSNFRKTKSGRKSINNGYLDITDNEDFLLKFHLMNPVVKTQRAILPLPTLADKKQYFGYTGIDLLRVDGVTFKNNKLFFNNIDDKVIDVLRRWYDAESNRINKVKEDIDAAYENDNYSNLIQNIHYQTTTDEGIPILFNEDGSYTANGLKRIYFKDDVKRSISGFNKLINDRTEDTINLAIKLKIITRNNRNKLENILLDPRLLSTNTKSYPNSYVAKYGDVNNAIYALMAEFTLNTIMSNIETDKIFTGDPAFYKINKVTNSVYEDKIKRISEIVAPGSLLRTSFKSNTIRIGDIDVTAKLTRKVYNVGSIQDHITDVNVTNEKLIADIKKVFAKIGLTEKEIEDRTSAWKKNNVTDASVWITPEFHRELALRLGEWTKENEEAYQLLLTDPDNIPIDKLDIINKLVTNPLKFVHYGLYNENGYAIPIYDKMAMFTIWPHTAEKGSILHTMHNKMISNNIDMIKVASAVKVGGRPSPKISDSNTEELLTDNLNNIIVKEQSLNNLRRQQITTPHYSNKRMLATQIKKLIIANLKKSATYKVNNKSYNNEELAKEVDTIYSEISNRGRKQLESILGIDLSTKNFDIKKLYARLQNDAIRANMPQQIIDALTVGPNGEKVNIDTLPDRRWVESKILALISKYTVDFLTPGDAFAQMSSFGFHKSTSNKLKLFRKDGRTEVMVSVALYRNVIPDYYKKSFKEKVEWLEQNRDIVEGIGYRIPTQGQNSAISFVVKDFLREDSGNTIVLPAEFTTLTGSDFDIDKLFLATYNYYYVNGQLQKFEFVEGDENGNITKEGLEKIWKQKSANSYNLIVRLENIIVDAKAEQGLTEDDIEFLNDKFPEIFTEKGNLKLYLLKDIKDKIEKDVVERSKVFIEKNLNKTAYEVNDEKAIQNKLLSIMKSILTNDEHSVETKTPLDTFTKQLQDLVQDIRTVTGKTKELSSFTEISPNYQLFVKSAYTGGKRGIGPFALHNVHHALTQIFKVLYRTGSKGWGSSTVDRIVNLSEIKGSDGYFILDWLSALINAHVDIAKDPYIFDLNINQRTYDLINYLIRAGAGKKAFYMMVQPGFVNKWKITNKKANVSELYTYAISHLKQVSKNEYSQTEIKDFVDEVVNRYSDPQFIFGNLKIESKVTESELLKLIGDETKPISERDWKWFAKQEGIRIMMGNLDKESRDLSTLVHSSRIDNKGYGNTVNSILQFQENYKKSFDTIENAFINGTDLLEKSFLSTLKNNVFEISDIILKELNINNTDLFRDLHKTIIASIHVPKMTDKDSSGFTMYSNYGEFIQAKREYERKLSTIEGELFASIVSRYFHSDKGYNFMNNESVRDLFFGKTSVGARIHKLTTTHPELRDNDLLKAIKPGKPFIQTHPDLWMIKTLNGDKTDAGKRENITEGWEELLEHSDPNIRKLGEDLFVISFITSGFNRRFYSFYHDIPIKFLTERSELLKQNGEIVKSYNEFITEIKDDFQTGNISYVERNNIMKDVFENNPNLIDQTLILPFESILIKDDTDQALSFIVPISSFAGKIPRYTQTFRVSKEGVVDYNAELIGIDIDKGLLLYKLFLDKGFDDRGYHVYEYVYDGSIFNNDKQYTEEEVIAITNTHKNKKSKKFEFEDIDYEERNDYVPYNVGDQMSENKEEKDTKKELQRFNIDYRMPMVFEDGTGGRKMRPEFKGKSTMDLILSGNRHATSRSQVASKGIQEGDIIQFFDDNNRSVLVRAITDEYLLTDDNLLDYGGHLAESIWTIEESAKEDTGKLTDKEREDLAARTWSYLEGWDKSMYKSLKNKEYKQFQFEVIYEQKSDALQLSLFDKVNNITDEEANNRKKECE